MSESQEALATLSLSVALSCLAWKGRKRGGVKAAAEREWHNGRRERVHGGEGGRADKDNVAITIGDCAAAAGCLPEDNFLIEVVLALFDFFRISQTKQD